MSLDNYRSRSFCNCRSKSYSKHLCSRLRNRFDKRSYNLMYSCKRKSECMSVGTHLNNPSYNRLASFQLHSQ